MDSVNDQESLQFWSTLLQSFANSNPKNDFDAKRSSPMVLKSTSMVTDVPLEPWNAPGAGEKEADGNKNIMKSIEKKIEEGAKEDRKTLGKRRRRNESRNMAERRRRTNIRTKIQKLKQMTPSCTKKDISSTLDSIIDHVRKMKLYIESQSVGSMMPLGMRIDFPAPWFPFTPPNLNMSFNDHASQPNGFTQGEPSRDDHEIVPVTNEEFKN